MLISGDDNDEPIWLLAKSPRHVPLGPIAYFLDPPAPQVRQQVRNYSWLGVKLSPCVKWGDLLIFD